MIVTPLLYKENEETNDAFDEMYVSVWRRAIVYCGSTCRE